MPPPAAAPLPGRGRGHKSAACDPRRRCRRPTGSATPCVRTRACPSIEHGWLPAVKRPRRHRHGKASRGPQAALELHLPVELKRYFGCAHVSLIEGSSTWGTPRGMCAAGLGSGCAHPLERTPHAVRIQFCVSARVRDSIGPRLSGLITGRSSSRRPRLAGSFSCWQWGQYQAPGFATPRLAGRQPQP